MSAGCKCRCPRSAEKLTALPQIPFEGAKEREKGREKGTTTIDWEGRGKGKEGKGRKEWEKNTPPGEIDLFYGLVDSANCVSINSATSIIFYSFYTLGTRCHHLYFSCCC